MRRRAVSAQGQQQANCAANRGEQNAFAEHLPKQAQRTGPESDSHRDFLLTRGGAG
jgi:hypothetical protein